MVFTLLPIFVPITPTLSLLSCMSSPVPCYPSCEFTMVFLPHISVSYLFSHIGSLFTWMLQQFFGRLPHLSGLFVVFYKKSAALVDTQWTFSTVLSTIIVKSPSMGMSAGKCILPMLGNSDGVIHC